MVKDKIKTLQKALDEWETQVNAMTLNWGSIQVQQANFRYFKELFSDFQKEYELSLAKERSLRKLWEDFDLQDYDNDDVIEWYNESKKVFAEDFAADKSFIQVSHKQLSDFFQEANVMQFHFPDWMKTRLTEMNLLSGSEETELYEKTSPNSKGAWKQIKTASEETEKPHYFKVAEAREKLKEDQK